MRRVAFMFLAAAFWSGCTLIDENPEWNPRADLPAWAYDAPFYYRPSEDLKAVEIIGPGIPIYYTNEEYFFLRHPGGYQPSGAPRVAVWCSVDESSWNRIGFFGVEQTHFLMQAECDGPHWVRFVGPGQAVTEVPPGQPHRIYVVDRVPPAIVINLTPPPYTEDEEGNRVRYIYKIGEKVRLEWQVTDENLRPESIRLGTCFPSFPHNQIWSRWPHKMEPTGSLIIEIPPEAVQDGGLRFRIEATDKAENIGMAMTETLLVEGMGQPGPQPGITPIGPDHPVHQTAGTPDTERPGWPRDSEFLRGGTTLELAWMPDTAGQYTRLELQFTSNDALAWHTIVTGLTAGKPFKWTVPKVTSKNCRIRIVGLAKDDSKIAIVTSARFTVDTVVPAVLDEPKPVAPE